MITGVWKGKVGNGLRPAKLELKLIQRGDSLFGTSYYYESVNSYRRYAVKGYFNQQSNEVIWWDDELLEAKTGRITITTPGAVPMLMEADFNCPGGGEMYLDGKAGPKDDKTGEIKERKIKNKWEEPSKSHVATTPEDQMKEQSEDKKGQSEVKSNHKPDRNQPQSYNPVNEKKKKKKR